MRSQMSVDVVVGAARVFRRQRVGAEEGGADVHRQQFAHAARHAQHLRFRRQVEAVAGLDLERGHALGQQGRDARRALAQQFGFAMRRGWRARST
jgi:hypothetical protein